MTDPVVDLALLRRLWRRWHDDGARLSDVDWRRPTRCGDWPVAALYAHVAQGVGGLAGLIGRIVEDEPTGDAAALLRRFHAGPPERSADLAARTARRASVDAADARPAELVERFAPDALAVLDRIDPGAVVDYFGHGLVRMADAVLLRIMEATVHLLDLDQALGRPPTAPADAVARSLDLLLALPEPLHLLEAAAGRRSSVLPVIG